MSEVIKGKWVSFNPFSPREMPSIAAVYVVFLDGRAVYVGQSKNLRERFYFHKFRHGYFKDVITPWGNFEDHRRLTLKCKFSKQLGDWAMWEIRLIHRLKPIFNSTYLKIKRAA